MKQQHYSLTDRQFIDQFEGLSFNQKWFTHEAHIRLAWAYLNLYSLGEAEGRMCTSIQRFDSIFDEGIKYHRTITLASIRIIQHRIHIQDSHSFERFIEANTDLVSNLKAVIAEYYSWNIFCDAKAQVSFVEPDLRRF